MTDAQGNSYGPYDVEVAGSESEALTEDAWYRLFGDVSGVVSGGALTFAGLTATISPIDVRSHGSFLTRTDPWSVASLPTTGASPRRDMVVARRQRTSGEGVSAVPGKTFLTLLQGTPAATPADPTPDPDDDEPLWSWQVPGGGGTVVTGQRDLRRPITNNAGTFGVLAGTAPPAGTPLLTKTYAGTPPATNAQGDTTISFPGGAFPNGLVSLHVNAVPGPAGPFVWLPWGPSLSGTNLRCYQMGSPTVITAATLVASVTAIGW